MFSVRKASLFSVSLFFFLLLRLIVVQSLHKISFKSSNLFPESLKWDKQEEHFIVGSFRHSSIFSVSDAGVVQTLISDSDLPPNSSILGIAKDVYNHRLLAVIHAVDPFPQYDALAAYDLRSKNRLFLAKLDDPYSVDRQIANDVAVDSSGNAFVTNSVGNFIWKVTKEGDVSIFSNSSAFNSQKIYKDIPGDWCGLNGIVFVNKGYLLVLQSNTGKVFKVDAEDGIARIVLISKDLISADGISLRSDGIAVVVSNSRVWFLKSTDSWAEAVICDEIEIDQEGFATAVAVRDGYKPYVLYGYMNEALLGDVEREEFRIEEIKSKIDEEGNDIWLIVLLALGLTYLMYWRFQMGELVKNMNKKTA